MFTGLSHYENHVIHSHWLLWYLLFVCMWAWWHINILDLSILTNPGASASCTATIWVSITFATLRGLWYWQPTSKEGGIALLMTHSNIVSAISNIGARETKYVVHKGDGLRKNSTSQILKAFLRFQALMAKHSTPGLFWRGWQILASEPVFVTVLLVPTIFKQDEMLDHQHFPQLAFRHPRTTWARILPSFSINFQVKAMETSPSGNSYGLLASQLCG